MVAAMLLAMSVPLAGARASAVRSCASACSTCNPTRLQGSRELIFPSCSVCVPVYCQQKTCLGSCLGPQADVGLDGSPHSAPDLAAATTLRRGIRGRGAFRRHQTYLTPACAGSVQRPKCMHAWNSVERLPWKGHLKRRRRSLKSRKVFSPSSRALALPIAAFAVAAWPGSSLAGRVVTSFRGSVRPAGHNRAFWG